jgi:hypothetical protein
MVQRSRPDEVALQGLLVNLSKELLVLASVAITIEDKVGMAISEGLPGGERLLIPLQGLDHLAQIANELAMFIDALSKSVDPGTFVSISECIQSIGLRSVADSLSGQSCKGSTTMREGGEVDFF